MIRSIMLVVALLTLAVISQPMFAQEKPVEEADTKTFTLTVLDETGKPIPHAKILFGGAPAPLQSKEKQEFGEESYGMSNTETDKNGQYIARFPVKELKDIQCLFFWVDTPGYAPYNGFWERPEADPVPSEFNVKLEKGTTIGGVVQNTEGKPIAGASVTVYIPWEKRSRGETNSNIHFHEIITDENGLWKYESIPLTLADKPTDWTIAQITHKDYMSLEDQSGNFSHFLADKNGEFKRVFTLPDGIPVKGRVTDESGKPIADALVVGHYRSTTDIVRLKTDEKGEFAFKNWPEHRGMGGNDSAYLAVRKPGFKTALESFDITREKPPTIDFVLKPVDKPIKIKIVDKEGKPVPNFMICIEQWKKSRLIAEDMLTGQEDQRGLTDEKGQWTWTEAPDDEVIFDILGRQYMSLRQVPLTARDEEYVFTVAPELKISGTVLDAVTNQPIPKFQVHFGFVWDEKHPLEFEPVPNVGGNGRYLINETYPRIYFQVKIEAEGYEPSISRKILSDEGAITVDFRLKKSTGN